MTKHARLNARGQVVDICDGDPANFFPANLASEFVAVPDHVGRGWKLDEGQWSELPKPDVSDMPVAEDGVPATLSQVEFVTLVQTVAGIDDAGFVALYENPALKGLWIKLQMAHEGVNRDHPLILGGLDALVAATDNVTADHKTQILALWPMEGT